MGMGCMLIECPECKGVGHVKDEAPLVGDSIVKQRGRPKTRKVDDERKEV